MSRNEATKHRQSDATQASNLYERLRSDLLEGILEPGLHLRIRSMVEIYGVGPTPVREALNRLVSEGLVICRDQRGFTVVDVGVEELMELSRTREWLESLALAKSMAASTPEWLESIIIAHHRLRRTKRSLSEQAYEPNPEWQKLHREFHNCLVSNCNSRWVTSFCSQLGDHFYRYSQLSMHRSFGVRDESLEHDRIVEAVIANDADLAIELLTGHYKETVRIILEGKNLSEGRFWANDRALERESARSFQVRQPTMHPRG